MSHARGTSPDLFKDFIRGGGGANGAKGPDDSGCSCRDGGSGHGSLAPTHEGRDKGAASGRSPNFAGCATKRGAVAAQGPPQLSDAGDLRRKLVGVGGREQRLSARGTRQRRDQPASQPASQRARPNAGNQRVRD